ncbi:MAG: glutamate racemase [Nitrospirae bacterium]|nr:MAG: glutamate racemase [Nitrospirota bacterium]
MNERPIGIFDSGIGGLTVLSEIRRLLPAEHTIYLGDTARVPYGIRSAETVTRYSFECASFLMRQNIKMLVVACNTVSAISLPLIPERVNVPVIGVIEPGARAAAAATRNNRVGVIGTEATVKSGAYSKAIKNIKNNIEVHSLACPLFVPLVEEGWTDGEIARLVIEKYLSGIKETGVDTLVLGCTHYPLLKPTIQSVMKDVALIDSAIETAKTVKELLEKTGTGRTSPEAAQHGFFVTDSPEKFISVGEGFLKRKIEDIKKIALPMEV